MQLRVGGLSESAIEEELVALFSRIGAVESARVIRDIDSGKSRGFALIMMPDSAEAEKAIKELNKQVLGSSPLTVMRIHDTLPGEMELREWLRDNARKVLERVGVRRNQAVLDFGCGPGIYSIACAGIVGRQGKVYALDVRPAALERLKETAKRKGLDNIETILMEASTLSIALENESLDVVLVYDVLQEVKDKPGLLKEMHRILRSGGLLSVFPMHLGTEKFMSIINALSLFRFRDIYRKQGWQSASEVLNFTKIIP